LPPALFCIFFAVPWQSQQSTEVWALAKVRFLIKPRKRIWDQAGIKELVTITAPKKIEVQYTDGLSETEVTSRLRALAETIDSRGWAVKNVNVNMFAQPAALNIIGAADANDDRLLPISTFSQELPTYEILASDDMLDTSNNPIAKQFDKMIAQSKEAQRKQIEAEMKQAAKAQAKASGAAPAPMPAPLPPQPTAAPNDYWFLAANNMPTPVVTPGAATVSNAVPVAATPTPDEVNLAAQIKVQSQAPPSYSHLRTIQPLGSQPPLAPPAVQATDEPVTEPIDPAILELANNNDLSVATIARQANKHQEDASDEVVISLH
jgi:hypothetical protein